MPNEQHTEQFVELKNYDLQEILDQARAERARLVREFFIALNRRLIQPFWAQTVKPFAVRFSH